MNSIQIRQPVQPWYREPWPWLIMLGPAVVIVAGVITTVIAFKTSDGLVADDYYKQGLAMNKTLARDRTQRFVLEPAACSDCGFVFRDRTRFTKPSRCPTCRSEGITGPRYGIEPVRK